MNAPVNQTTLSDVRAVAAQREASLPAVRTGFFDLQSFELLQRVAKAFASSSLVPKEYQGNVANCMIALNLAQRLGADALMVMQNLVIVHGRPTWAAQFLIATANMCGRFTAIRFEFFGERNTDGWGCRAWAMEKGSSEKLFGSEITIAIAKKEGWYAKNGSKWQSIPQQMLMYRAGSWWVRAYAPELSMGLMTADEAADVVDLRQGGDGTWHVDMSDLQQGVKTAAEPAQAAKPAAHVDQETGEITPQAASSVGQKQEAPQFDADAFSQRLEQCKDADTLDVLADEIRALPTDADTKDLLADIYRRRRDELQQQPAQQAQQQPTGRRQRAQASME